MSKSIEHKKKSVFLRILEDKRAIRKCVQEGGDVKKLAKERGIKFSTLLWSYRRKWMELFLYN